MGWMVYTISTIRSLALGLEAVGGRAGPGQAVQVVADGSNRTASPELTLVVPSFSLLLSREVPAWFWLCRPQSRSAWSLPWIGHSVGRGSERERGPGTGAARGRAGEEVLWGPWLSGRWAWPGTSWLSPHIFSWEDHAGTGRRSPRCSGHSGERRSTSPLARCSALPGRNGLLAF